MSSLGNQNQLQLSLAPLRELLKAVRLLLNFNGFNSPSYPSGQKFMQKKGSPSKSPIWKEKILSDFSSFLISCMICGVVWVSLILMLCLFVWFFFFFFFFFFCALFFLIKKLEKSEKYKNNVCLCILVLMYLGWPLKQGFLTLYHL